MAKKFETPILVTKSAMPSLQHYMEYLQEIWNTRILTNNGPLHTRLEKKLEEYLKVPNVTMFTNGHLGLDCAIRALNLKGEVITTPFTFVSTTHAISMNGLKPVFCDIKMSDYTMDESKIEGLINENTCAIVPVHVYGHPCNVEKIQEIADKYHLAVIYDAAHAFGVEVDGKGIAEFGDLSMFSFHATKVFNTIEGGAVTYRNGEYKKQLNLLKNFGISGPEDIDIIGLNAKMNEFQAAMGLANLETIDEKILNRKQAYTTYLEKLAEVPGLRFVKLADNITQNYSYMPVLVEEDKFGKTRDQLFDALAEYNVFARKYFYPLISNTEAYADVDADVPVAQYVSDRILCLPLYGDMTVAEVMQICDIIREIQQK